MRYLVYALLVALYVLHTDVWYWNDARPLLGLPIGITYHVLWTLAVSACFALAVRYAWPEELETLAEESAHAERQPVQGDGAPARETGS